MRASFAFLFVLALVVTAHAEQFSLMGYGVQSCAKYGQAYKESPDDAELVYYAWALGFMSGLNVGTHTHRASSKNLAATTQDEQRRFLREWCEAHPLSDFGSGVVELLKTLPEVTDKQP
jgi:hypothetical protein